MGKLAQPPTFADALAAQPGSTIPVRCGVALYLRDAPPADATALRAALANHDIEASRIARALHATGHKVTEYSIRRHRRKVCLCE